MEGGEASRGAHDPAARVRGRTAHPQVPQRRSVPRPSRYRSVEEELLEGELALEDVALGQPEPVLDVLGGQDLRVQDQLADVGARSSMVSRTVSANASRRASSHSSPSTRRYGAYWTKQLMTCLPGGAIDGSTWVGMIMSMYGRRLYRPSFASS